MSPSHVLEPVPAPVDAPVYIWNHGIRYRREVTIDGDIYIDDDGNRYRREDCPICHGLGVLNADGSALIPAMPPEADASA